jgi:hypothetical protein
LCRAARTPGISGDGTAFLLFVKTPNECGNRLNIAELPAIVGVIEGRIAFFLMMEDLMAPVSCVNIRDLLEKWR